MTFEEASVYWRLVKLDFDDLNCRIIRITFLINLRNWSCSYFLPCGHPYTTISQRITSIYSLTNIGFDLSGASSQMRHRDEISNIFLTGVIFIGQVLLEMTGANLHDQVLIHSFWLLCPCLQPTSLNLINHGKAVRLPFPDNRSAERLSLLSLACYAVGKNADA